MAESELLLTVPPKSAEPEVTLPSLLSVEASSSPDIMCADSSSFTVSPKVGGNALLSSWLQGIPLRGSAHMFGASSGCVLPPVGELQQRSGGQLDILGMLNCSRLQGISSQESFMDFTALPKLSTPEQRHQLPDFPKESLSEVGLSVSKVDLKNHTAFALDGSEEGLARSASSQPFADTLTAAGGGWSDAGLPKDWNAASQDMGVLLSPTAFPDCAESIFAQCVEDIQCYKCKLCTGLYVSLSREDALSHLLGSHAKEVEFLQRGEGPWLEPIEPEAAASFVCGKCQKSFLSLRECQQHMGLVHQVRSSRIREDKRLLLPQDGKKKDPKLKSLCKKRKKREHGCYICEFKGCNVRFRILDNLSYHGKCHVSSGGFACPECSYVSRRWSSMAGHLWRQHVVDLELHACDRCSFRTYNLSLLENLHKRTHGEERPYVCDVGSCGKSFKTNKQLRSHKVLHSRKHAGSSLPSGECLLCHRRFLDKRMLRVHLDMVHRKMKPYLCNYCGFAASSKSTLRMHLRQHTGEKPFACHECDYRTADHNSLRRHKMRHSGEKPYKCPHCPYACIQSSTYKSHLRSKHPGQDKGLMFSCNLCPFHTIKEDTYLTHMANHSLGCGPQLPLQPPDDHHLLSLVEAVQISIGQPQPSPQL